jgi:hypothetical protein
MLIARAIRDNLFDTVSRDVLCMNQLLAIDLSCVMAIVNVMDVARLV